MPKLRHRLTAVLQNFLPELCSTVAPETKVERKHVSNLKFRCWRFTHSIPRSCGPHWNGNNFQYVIQSLCALTQSASGVERHAMQFGSHWSPELHRNEVPFVSGSQYCFQSNMADVFSLVGPDVWNGINFSREIKSDSMYFRADWLIPFRHWCSFRAIFGILFPFFCFVVR